MPVRQPSNTCNRTTTLIERQHLRTMAFCGARASHSGENDPSRRRNHQRQTGDQRYVVKPRSPTNKGINREFWYRVFTTTQARNHNNLDSTHHFRMFSSGLSSWVDAGRPDP